MTELSIRYAAEALQRASYQLSLFAGAAAEFPNGVKPGGFGMLNIEASANTVAKCFEDLFKAVEK